MKRFWTVCSRALHDVLKCFMNRILRSIALLENTDIHALLLNYNGLYMTYM